MVAGNVSYDARGNITALGGVTMAFDAENNLKSETEGTTSNWVYDAEGQRAEKQIPGGAATVYVHDALLEPAGGIRQRRNDAGLHHLLLKL